MYSPPAKRQDIGATKLPWLVAPVQSPSKSTHISALFPEVLSMIFSHLSIKDKGRSAQVCQAWRDAAYDKSVWRGVQARVHLCSKTDTIIFSSLVRRGIKKVEVLSLRRSLKDLIRGIPEMESLSLQGCFNVTDIVLAVGFKRECLNITHLNLSLCKQITDNSLSCLVRFVRNLEVLELGGCGNITNNGLLCIAWGFQRLKHLNLRSCRNISDKGIANICGTNNTSSSEDQAPRGNLFLEYLSLQDCQRLGDLSLKSISHGLVHLKTLDMSFCASITDSGLKPIGKMPSLIALNLSNCDNISDMGIAYLAEGSSRILHLNLNFCEKITDAALAHISQWLFQLRFLSVNTCKISDGGLEKVARSLHDLHTLNIAQCHLVTDKGVAALASGLGNLVNVDLYGCFLVSKEAKRYLKRSPNLKTLNLGIRA